MNNKWTNFQAFKCPRKNNQINPVWYTKSRRNKEYVSLHGHKSPFNR